MITVGATTPGRLRPHSPSITAPDTSTPYIITGTPGRPGITSTGSLSAAAGPAPASARPAASSADVRLRCAAIGVQASNGRQSKADRVTPRAVRQRNCRTTLIGPYAALFAPHSGRQRAESALVQRGITPSRNASLI